ncbi:hypothetical protein A2483_01480 [Candidatus Peregrinibacteria bacterium RIFOXYC2_FULL_33_13]|nr:MAG: Transcriptional regulator, TrmB [Candidatus Peregrinibacteria bacterium GW2011_GWA2_33_10]KKP38302.1 MAG: transcriptional regulator TrmB [Candidatus Peregrinibacteria bacterium GW2011_GWC2_33_13]OGJ46744.1 MAG: hypothetical protein A2229_01375 [Candidatus Peregrinibacteria bacterium RIFOXYA2_FULL_33_7]OGJ52829.1 MAG: hypothetical protein A2483_01480 [Candidatus Peregrinibacteria bacterium RIFOXYC2_FULL_33_13]
MLQSFLQKIGLSDKESIIYLTSLRFGSQPVSVIAKHSEINRTTVYDLFESLIKKGLATKICKGTTTYFQVSDPKNLINYLEREQNEYIRKTEKQINEVKNILPALKSLENPQSTKPKVQFFDGEKGMREAYEDTLTSTESIRAYANVEEMHKGLPNFFPDYYKRRSDANIFIRSISPDNKLSLERHKYDKTENREMKFIPAQKYNFSPELNVYDDKIMIASWQEKMAIIIKSKEIADLHKMIYDLLWDKL